MKIVLHHTLRSIRAHLAQPIVITLTIVVVTFLLFASLSLKNVFYNFQVANLSRVSGDADVAVSGEIFSGEKLNAFVSDRSDRIERCQKYLSMIGLVEGKDDESTVVTVEATDIKQLVTYEKDRFAYYDGIGAGTKYVFPAVMIGKSFAETMDLQVGDELDVYLSFYGRKQTFSVTYIFENKGIFANTSIYNVLTDIGSIGDKGLYTDAYLTLKKGVDTEQFVEELRAYMDNPTLTIGYAVDYEYVNDLVNNNEKLLSVALVFVIALVVFILLSAYKIVAQKRAEEMSVFKAAGATPGQIFMILLCEVVLYGLIGGGIGVIASRFSMEIVVSRVIPSYRDAIRYEVWQYAVAIVLAVAISVFGSLAPMYSLVKKSIRASGANGVKKVRTFSPVFVGVFASITVACVVCMAFLSDYTEIFTPILLVASVGLIVTGTPYSIRFFALPFMKGKGVSYLAQANVKRSAECVSLSRMIAAIIVFAFVILNVVNVILDASQPYTLRFTSDYVVQSLVGNAEAETFRTYISERYGVEKVALTYYETFEKEWNGKKSSLTVYAVKDASDLAVRASLTEREKADFDNVENAAIVGYDLLNRLRLRVGDTLVTELYGDTYEWKIVASDTTRTSDDRVLFVKMEDLAFMPKNTLLFVNTSKNIPQADLYAELRQNLEAKGLFIMRFEKWAYAAGLAIHGLGVLLHMLQVLVGLVGAIGVVNMTVSMLTTRTREFSVYKSCGLDDGRLGKMALAESLLISLNGAVIGAALCAIFSVPLISFASLIDRYVGWEAPWIVLPIAECVLLIYATVYYLISLRYKRVQIRESIRF